MQIILVPINCLYIMCHEINAQISSYGYMHRHAHC